MTMLEIAGEGFDHLVIQRLASPPRETLHVYIEGDGLPWLGNRASADPTQRTPLALSLAGLDKQDVAYIGRPCYFGVADASRCHPRIWTSHRYSAEVVSSMAAAIQRVRRPEHGAIVLIGYSGGGTLAALLESQVADVAGVVSIAANLDIDAWTTLHGYDALSHSLNPIRASRAPDVVHLQLVGRHDTKVPPSISIAYANTQPGVELIEFEHFDHVCCWEDQWPSILPELSARLDSSGRKEGPGRAESRLSTLH
ncbi:MAG: hypothetical protein HKN64_01390 [Woeseiaceae bacterium]|nr:hypothetical protein [Woeseiaceae bacterium]